MNSASIYSAEALEDYAYSVFRAMSADADVAEEVARHLVRANLSGHDSHGMIRIAQYVGQMDRSELMPAVRASFMRP